MNWQVAVRLRFLFFFVAGGFIRSCGAGGSEFGLEGLIEKCGFVGIFLESRLDEGNQSYSVVISFERLTVTFDFIERWISET